MSNYFLLHGSYSSSNSNWFPWLESQISRGGGEQCLLLDFPTGIGKQTYQNWEMVLSSVKRYINEESVFFCHSIACIFLVKFCIKNNIKIKRAVFVSGFNDYVAGVEDYDVVNAEMYTTGMEKFKDLCGERICIYSNNDPNVPYDKLEEFAKSVGGKSIEIPDAGHFNTASGYTKFETLLKYL